MKNVPAPAGPSALRVCVAFAFACVMWFIDLTLGMAILPIILPMDDPNVSATMVVVSVGCVQVVALAMSITVFCRVCRPPPLLCDMPHGHAAPPPLPSRAP